MLQSCPHLFFAGNQPRLQTTVIEGDIFPPSDRSEEHVARVRLLALPQFYETGELVLVDAETLEVEVVKFGVFEATGGKGKR